jgi:hypothetical protein
MNVCPPPPSQVDTTFPSEAERNSLQEIVVNVQTFLIEGWGEVTISYNEPTFAALINYISNLKAKDFILHDSVAAEAHLMTDLYQGFEDGSRFITHDYSPSSCLLHGAFAWTVNPADSTEGPSVSLFPIQAIEQTTSNLTGADYTGEDLRSVYSQAVVVEMVQQLYGPTIQTGILESVAHSVSYAILFAQVNSQADLSSLYEAYLAQVAEVNQQGIRTNDPANPVIGVSPLKPEVFESLREDLSNAGPLVNTLDYSN